MTIKRIAPFLLAAFVATSAVAGVALAETNKQDARDIAAAATLKISLVQAIATAEQKTGGRAVGADLSTEGGTTHIAVETAAADGVKTVIVDAQSGQITALHNGGHDGEKDGEDND